MIKKELSRMISRAATKNFVDKIANDENSQDNSEMKKYIMQDSFQSDNSYEESSESEDF